MYFFFTALTLGIKERKFDGMLFGRLSHNGSLSVMLLFDCGAFVSVLASFTFPFSEGFRDPWVSDEVEVCFFEPFDALPVHDFGMDGFFVFC